jgi:hypothetical protein
MKSVLAKISRAEQLKDDLTSVANEYWNSVKYDCAIEDDRPVYRIREIKQVPNQLNCIFGDLIHNLNSALDCIAYSEYAANGSDNVKSNNVYFPVSYSAKEFEAKLEHCKNISDNFYSVMSKIQPHKDNNLILWQIRKLDNLNKHRNIIISLPEVSAVNVAADMKLPFDIKFFLKPADGKMCVGEKIFTGAPNTVCEVSREFIFDLVLNEIEVGPKLKLGKFTEQAICEIKKVHEFFI